MTRLARSFTALACILGALNVQAQQRQQRQAASTNAAPEPPVENPDLVSFKHAVAVAATPAQTAEFKLLAQSTAAARQRARELKQLGNSADVSVPVRQATALQDAVDEVQTASHEFLNSLSDSQDAGLKPLTRKLIKSDVAVNKRGNRLDEQLKNVPIDSQRIANAAAGLEKSLAALQASQLRLAKEMGIETH